MGVEGGGESRRRVTLEDLVARITAEVTGSVLRYTSARILDLEAKIEKMGEALGSVVSKGLEDFQAQERPKDLASYSWVAEYVKDALPGCVTQEFSEQKAKLATREWVETELHGVKDVLYKDLSQMTQKFTSGLVDVFEKSLRESSPCESFHNETLHEKGMQIASPEIHQKQKEVSRSQNMASLSLKP